jgi:hypothetical protein
MARVGFGVDGFRWKGHDTLKKVAALGDTGNAPLPGSVFTPRQVRLLKIAVIVMGVLLVGGFAFVLAAIVYQASHPGQAGMATSASLHAAPEPGIDLPVGRDATVAAMSLDGSRLALHLTTAAGPEIVVIDLGSGKVVARVRLKPE